MLGFRLGLRLGFWYSVKVKVRIRDGVKIKVSV